MDLGKLRKRIGKFVWSYPRRIFSERTIAAIQFDLLRWRARRKRSGKTFIKPNFSKLQIGSGKRTIPNWLNVDVINSDFDVDLAGGTLPWCDDCFDAVVGQHVIEHLEIKSELIPLLKELQRVIRPGGEIWLSCPDIEKVCRSYINHGMQDLLDDRLNRWTTYQERDLRDLPISHLINDIFHQEGEHKNLFDFTLLAWALDKAGFCGIEQVNETDLLVCFPDFPPRHDDNQSIYVYALTPN